jgi:hypothetical protein
MSRKMACSGPETSNQAIPSRKSLIDRILTGLGVLVTLVSGYINTSFLLAGCIEYLVSPVAERSCSTCKPSFDISPRGFADRLWSVLPILCFAPYQLPKELWRIAFPPPCEYNRCRLKRYMAPSRPWYHCLQHFYKPLQLQPPRSHQPFPFLKLPLELRNQIYHYASYAHTIHTIQVVSQWRAGERAHCSYSHTGPTWYLAEYDAYKPSANDRQANWGEAAVSYQLNDDGIIAIHGTPPPTNLLLVNKQVYAEARELFWSTTAFEVQPLTPNNANEWSISGYETLATSNYALQIQKVRVRIDVARFSMGREYMWPRVRGITFREIEVGECLQRLVLLAENLSIVLGTSMPNLRVVEIDWVDEFADVVDESSLQLRATVLAPFTSMSGISARLRKLQAPESGKKAIQSLVRQTLSISQAT